MGLVSMLYFIWVGQGQAAELFIKIAPTTFIGALLLLSGWLIGAVFGLASIVRGEKYLWLSLFSFALNSLPFMGLAYLFSG